MKLARALTSIIFVLPAAAARLAGSDATNDPSSEPPRRSIRAHGSGSNTISTLRWASAGGGLRSQFACVGLANLFSQLDILTEFSAISTTSSASWFSPQLFYSEEFYDRVALADVQSLHNFVVDWMGSYSNRLTGAIQDGGAVTVELERQICSVADSQILSDLCSTLVYFKFDWAFFVREMLDAGAKSYGDMDFANKMAGNDNRVEALKGTDMLVQSSLAPNSRIRSKNGGNDVVVFIGPNGVDTTYTVPISVAYVVNNTGTTYRYATESLQGDLIVQTSQTSPAHSFVDWEDFYLFPAENGTDLIDGNITESSNSNIFSEPFGGSNSSVIQVGAISSAAVGAISHLAPSTFTQSTSVLRYEREESVASLKAFEKTVAIMYNLSLFDNFAVCSQWPDPCGQADGMFVDGALSDKFALAINVGQYHISGGELNETLKVILTNTNDEWPNDFQYTQILQHFESPINRDVDPGSFIWPSGMPVPYQSPQIFSDVMDSSMLEDHIEPISGSNMTTATLKGTTIDSPIFGIRAGQKVEILLINLNEPITTYIASPNLVELYTEPLANMTRNIAMNKELASRIKAFVGPLSDDKPEDCGGAEPPAPSSGTSLLQVGKLPTVAALTSLLFLVDFFCSA